MSLSENQESGPVPTPVPLEPPRPTPAGAFAAVPTTLASPPVTPMPSPGVETSAPHPSAASAAIARVLARAPTPPPFASNLPAPAPPATVMIARQTSSPSLPPSAPPSSSIPSTASPSSVASSVPSSGAPSSAGARVSVQSAPPVSVAPSPLVDDAPGPITLRSRAFFSEAEARGPDKSDALPFPAPPLVPLPKRSSRPAIDHAEMSGGVLVIQRTSTAWIATAVAVGVGLVVALLLGLDGASTSEALAKSQAEVASLTTKLADAEAAATKPAMVLVPKGAPLPPTAEETKPIADAFDAAFKREIARGDAKVIVDGARVKFVLNGSVLFDAKKTSLARRADGVLDRLSATLKPMPHRVDVIAHSDGTAGRGKSEWGQSAARATIVVRALENSGVAGERLAAVGRGFAEPVGKSASANRRLEIVVTTR